MSAFTFLEKEQIAQTTVLVMVTAEGEDGKHYYAYAAVRAPQLETLRKKQASGKPYHLQDYGKILAAGVGEPTPEVQRRMEEEYGFSHELALVL